MCALATRTPTATYVGAYVWNAYVGAYVVDDLRRALAGSTRWGGADGRRRSR